MNKINKINICCQKVLPLVYDESLSYYEVLCKVIQKLNELIKINNNIRDEIHKEYVEILESAKTVTEAVASVTAMRDEVLTLKQATEQYANDVVTVYNETVQARDTAIAKANIAEQSASTASAKANIAQASATTATEKAESAEQSANTAAQKANIAQASATTATEKAEVAVTNADIAKNNADKVITAMSLVAGTVNYYDSGATPWVNRIYFTSNISVYQSLNAFIRNNILYLVISLQLRYTNAGVYKLPDLLTVELSLTNTKLWSNSKLKNIDWANLPIVSYGGTNSEIVGDLGTCFSKAGGHSIKGTELPSYPVQLQVFNNDHTELINDSGKSTDFTFNFTVAQPLKFINEETPTPTDYIAKLDEEKQAREQGDATLQQNIDNLSNDVFHKNQVVPIANGGTGASDANNAFKNLTMTNQSHKYVELQKTQAVTNDSHIGMRYSARWIFIQGYSDINVSTDKPQTFIPISTFTNPFFKDYDLSIYYAPGTQITIKDGTVTLEKYVPTGNFTIKGNEITGLIYLM